MVRRVQKWGNSLALRIPRALADEIGLQPDTPVELSLAEGKLVLAPVTEPTLTLDDLLAQVTKDNTHKEIDDGSPVGSEAW